MSAAASYPAMMGAGGVPPPPWEEDPSSRSTTAASGFGKIRAAIAKKAAAKQMLGNTLLSVVNQVPEPSSL